METKLRVQKDLIRTFTNLVFPMSCHFHYIDSDPTFMKHSKGNECRSVIFSEKSYYNDIYGKQADKLRRMIQKAFPDIECEVYQETIGRPAWQWVLLCVGPNLNVLEEYLDEVKASINEIYGVSKYNDDSSELSKLIDLYNSDPEYVVVDKVKLKKLMMVVSQNILDDLNSVLVEDINLKDFIESDYDYSFRDIREMI